MLTSVHVIYASTSGHTEYVVDECVAHLQRQMPRMPVERQMAERASAEDLMRGDLLILASGTWNNEGQEGHLNPHMRQLLLERCKDLNLKGRPMAFISLGDDRYYYRTRCTEHFMKFMRRHGGTQLLLPLAIVNEPYGQEEKIQLWTEKLLNKMGHETPAAAPLVVASA